ncbi:hypothetical protein DESC_10074 [Desulfosarcina cetonica]|nr:hypothetical protein DESC_10074 [Desulfosarcina cetonica]
MLPGFCNPIDRNIPGFHARESTFGGVNDHCADTGAINLEIDENATGRIRPCVGYRCGDGDLLTVRNIRFRAPTHGGGVQLWLLWRYNDAFNGAGVSQKNDHH